MYDLENEAEILQMRTENGEDVRIDILKLHIKALKEHVKVLNELVEVKESIITILKESRSN